MLRRTGTPNIAYVNELIKPYAGPGYGVEELDVRGGHNIHATPSYAALECSDYAVESLPLFIISHGGKTYIEHEAMEQTVRLMARPWALNLLAAQRDPSRQMPTLSLVTTQSYNMTRIIAYWLEEEMANFLLVSERGWDAEVEAMVKEWKGLIKNATYQAAKEGGLLESENHNEEVLDCAAAVPDVDVACIAVEARCTEADRRLVQAEMRVIQNSDPRASKSEARRRAMNRFTVDATTGLLERRRSSDPTGAKGCNLAHVAQRFMRLHRDLAVSTARKHVIAAHMIKGECSQTDLDKVALTCVGPRKAYHLAYTSSRINLGIVWFFVFVNSILDGCLLFFLLWLVGRSCPSICHVMRLLL